MLKLKMQQLFFLGPIYVFPVVTTDLDCFGRATLAIVFPVC